MPWALSCIPYCTADCRCKCSGFTYLLYSLNSTSTVLFRIFLVTCSLCQTGLECVMFLSSFDCRQRVWVLSEKPLSCRGSNLTLQVMGYFRWMVWPRSVDTRSGSGGMTSSDLIGNMLQKFIQPNIPSFSC